MGTVILVAIFIASSILIDSLSYWFRAVGALNGEAALGYSSQIRIGTMGRFFLLASAPLLGFMVDKGIDPDRILLIGVIAFSILFCIILVNLNSKNSAFFRLYQYLNFQKKPADHATFATAVRVIKFRMVVLSIFAFMLTASGILVVNYIAAIFIEQRAMIIQMAALVTMFGTIIHAFVIDPWLAKTCDAQEPEAIINLVKDFLLGRLVASILLTIMFFSIMFWF